VVRIAALRALRQLGDASAVPLLLAAAVESDAAIAQEAQSTLAALAGGDVDAAILARLDGSDNETRRILLAMVGRRRMSAAVPALLEAVGDADEEIQLAALQAMGETAGLEHLRTLTDRLTANQNSRATAATKRALTAICMRMPDREACAAQLVACLPESPPATKAFLLELLGSVGGPTALEAVAAGARDASPHIQDAATRVLGQWMSPAAAPELLQLAKTLTDAKLKTRCLRGYIRITRQLGMTSRQRLSMCQEALAVAERDEEKKLILEVLGRIPCAESLSLILPHLRNQALKQQAGTIAVDIAEKIVRNDPAAVSAAMQQVMAADVSQEVTGRAEALLK
jgi:hypothetical protein